MNKVLQPILFFCLAVSFPVLAAEEDEKQSWLREQWNWLWTNIQDVEALVALVLVVGGGILWVWKFKQTATDTPTEQSVNSLSEQQLDKLYYSELSQRCQRYDLGSFRDSQSLAEQSVNQVHLSDVYVDLRAHEIEKKENNQVDPDSNVRTFQAEKSELLLGILVDQTKNRLVVRGDVGSGKSSFINYLCYSIVESHSGCSTSPDVPQHWLRRPVIRLLLREIGSQVQQGDAEEQLLDFIKQRVIAQLGEQSDTCKSSVEAWWEAFWQAFKQNGVLILDGLDEVSGSFEQAEGLSRRQVLLNGIHQFARNVNCQGVALIITSRNHAYGGDDALPDFKLFQLEPLNVSDRYAVFIRHWYERVAYTEEEKLSFRDDARELLNNIAKSSSLPALTETPLLLTLILVLDKAEIGLPDSRAELYQNAVSLLLDRWNKQLMQYSDSLSIEEQQALQVLKQDVNILKGTVKYLAYKTYQDEENPSSPDTAEDAERRIVFPVEVVNEALKEQLEQHSGLGFAHQDACRYFLRFRSQLLVAAGEHISFVHKSFHEYLAAAYLMDLDMSRDEGLWEMAATPAKRDWWEKVFLFALNIAGAEYVMKLMKSHVLSKQLAAVSTDEMQNHLDVFSAFSRAALENNLELFVSRNGQRRPYLQSAYNDLQQYIALFWERTDLSIEQRAQLGRIAGRCGDTRKGVGLKRDENFIFHYHKTATHSFPIPDFDWREITPGEFLMGTEGDGYADEKPPQMIRFTKPFYMTGMTITNAQYQAFIDAGGYSDESIWRSLPNAAFQWWQGEFPGMELIESYSEEHQQVFRKAYQGDHERRQPRYWQSNRWNISNHPVIGISWFEALAYCEWLNRHIDLVLPEMLVQQGFRIRMPTEDEWEYAARGSGSLKFSSGGEFSGQDGNYDETELKRTSAAGVFKVGAAYELYDMSGNIWEWTSSRWGKSFYDCGFKYGDNYISFKRSQNNPEPVEFRIIRGGSWGNTSDVCRCAVRYGLYPDYRYDNVGFRVVCVESS